MYHIFNQSLTVIFVLLAFLSVKADKLPTKNIEDEFVIHAKYTTSPITVDGQIDESIWAETEEVSGFWLSSPDDGRIADEEYGTKVKLAYDDDNLYIAAVCKGGKSFVMPSLKRDTREFWDGDVFGAVIDPVNERTNGFIFATNTAGVQLESLISGGMARRNGVGSVNINGAWDQSWVSEAQVFDDYWTVEMAIPFKSLRYGEKEEWGINFWRGITENNEWHSWTRMSIEFMVIDLGHTGTLKWESPPKKSKSNISVVPYVLASTTNSSGDNEPSDQNLRVGADAKVALTSTINLDLTINPDFSQVDVDEQVTNLTTVNLRFPERRLFFLENSDLFSDFGIPPIRPFFSRRIGLDASGGAIPIAYGARLSGNANKDLRLGLMNLQTKVTDEFQAQNYTSLAAHQQVLGRSIIKGYAHNRQATTASEFETKDYNRVAGFEMQYFSKNSRFRTAGGGSKSWSSDISGDDLFYTFLLGYNTRNVSFYTNFSGMGDNYRSDVGFNPRFNHYDAVRDTTVKIGYHHGFSSLSYQFLPEDQSVINSQSIGITNVLDYSQDNFDLITNRSSISYNLRWTNSSNLRVSISHDRQGLLFPFAFTDKDPLPSDVYKYNYFRLNYQSDQRKPFGFELGYQNGGFYNGNRQEYQVQLRYRQQPWGNFRVNAVYNKLTFPEQYGESELFLLGAKFEINFTRNLFWTTFLQYNTQAENFNVNSRLQWRFKPLSDIFLVYSDNYTTENWGPKNRGLVLKLNYWLNL
tara:strand:+ start:231 stop:2483 length:2253 start_codon:yes stop_codon:yes gene_type:complete